MQNHPSHKFSRLATTATSGATLRMGEVKFDYKAITYGGNPASAALRNGAAFFVCANNPKIFIAMIKNNFIESEIYVSPAVKVTQLKTRRVMCVSPGNLNQLYYSDPGYAGGDAEEEDGGSLF